MTPKDAWLAGARHGSHRMQHLETLSHGPVWSANACDLTEDPVSPWGAGHQFGYACERLASLIMDQACPVLFGDLSGDLSGMMRRMDADRVKFSLPPAKLDGVEPRHLRLWNNRHGFQRAVSHIGDLIHGYWPEYAGRVWKLSDIRPCKDGTGLALSFILAREQR